eukprot:gnl/MRDRNA2_/MRDRNA2_161236_c0_seq1.p2 gnl/MRDRNA2_/MRDRNA2_161236_c0~~gnl/MRDRNA2_/MRDRNA2_161236_c0_seq1.p2  ORF type:complete len:105 (-),score=15.40 gnl/MRDRNA2_/MRDRNA2_161236_c0_seq1:23-307(-)
MSRPGVSPGPTVVQRFNGTWQTNAAGRGQFVQQAGGLQGASRSSPNIGQPAPANRRGLSPGSPQGSLKVPVPQGPTPPTHLQKSMKFGPPVFGQ